MYSTLTKKPEEDKQIDKTVKILLIGNAGVGKSSILLQYSDHKFAHNYYNTIGIDYKIKYLTCRGLSIKLQIWDTAGQDRFKTITSSYYRGADGIAVVYDITDRNSFENVRNWLEEIDKYTDQRTYKYIVGNKCDLQEKRKVTTEEAHEFTQKLNIPFRETSARLTTNVNELFQDLLDRILFPNDASTTSKEQEQKTATSPEVNEVQPEPLKVKKLMEDKRREQGRCCMIY